MSSATPAGKTMSSRLLTMKFMQRAAASPSSPASADERASKRQRLSSGPSRRDNDDMHAVQAALAAEEAKRQEALERQAADAGETKWVLNLPTAEVAPLAFTVVSAGFGTIDAGGSDVQEEEDALEDERPSMPGRKSYGDFGKQEKTEGSAADSDESDDGSDSNSDSEDDDEEEPRRRKVPSEAAEALRAKRAARKQHERADGAMMAERRRNKEVKLNRLSGISSGGGGSFSGASFRDTRTKSSNDGGCFKCGGPHKKAACPQLRGSRR